MKIPDRLSGTDNQVSFAVRTRNWWLKCPDAHLGADGLKLTSRMDKLLDLQEACHRSIPRTRSGLKEEV